MSESIHQSVGTTSARDTSVPVIEAFVLGPFATNCYLVRREGASGCWIVDPGLDPAGVIHRVRTLGLTPQAILLTHAHVDHIAGVDNILRTFPGIPVYLHDAERDWLADPMLNLSALSGMEITAQGPHQVLSHGQTVSLEGMDWTVLHTPGHSPGGVTFYHAPSHSAIVGDALFAGSIGRTDFPGSDFATLERAIRTHLYTLPEDTTIYPGHGPASTIGVEKRSNPFVRP